MGRRIIVVATALGMMAPGCTSLDGSSNRLDRATLGAANDRFGVKRDIVVVKDADDREKRADSLSHMAAAGSIGTLLGDYEKASTHARDSLAAKSPSAPEDLAAYRSAGFDLSRGTCAYAFNLLGESHSKYKFGSSMLSILATGGASLLGIGGASGEATSIYALVTSLAQSWSDNYEEYAFLAQSVGTLSAKVREAQDTYRTGIEKAPAPRTWSEATVQIQRYNDFCLATGMRTLVEEAVGKAQLEFNDERKDVEIVNARSEALVNAANKAREEVIYRQQLSDIAVRYKRASIDLDEGLQERRAAAAALEQLPTTLNTADIAALEAQLGMAKAEETTTQKNSPQDQLAIAAAKAKVALIEGALKAKRTLEVRDATWEAAVRKLMTDAELERKAVQAKISPAPEGV